MSVFSKRLASVLAMLVVGVAVASAQAQYSITVLHNNDGESDILSDGTYGGISRFKTLVDTTRSFYTGQGHGVLTVYAGDSFLASPEFQASLDSGPAGSRDFYDAFALSEIGYDAAVFGNHEFDFGPDVLAEFIGDAQSTNPVPYISANLDFSGEASLNALVNTSIFSSVKVSVPTSAGSKTVGIIGATTENLPFISSPGGVTVNPIVAAVNSEIANLQGQSVDHIILVSHLQGINEDLNLIPQLAPGLDLVVAGGGDEILADLGAPSPVAGAPASVADTGLLPGDSVNQPAYPNITAMDSGGNTVPVVTGGPNYGYLGRVTLNFDPSGNLLGAAADSNPQIVADASLPFGVAKDPTVETNSEAPVAAYKANLASIILATASQTLIGNGNRDVIRAKEAGLGNLVADGMLAAATSAAPGFGLSTPDFAISNGGGIRDDMPAGDVSVATTFDISPFGNVVSIVEDVTREDVKKIFENAYSKTIDGDPSAAVDPVRAPVDGTGRFLHVSEGVEVVYDITRTAMELDKDGNILVQGSRIISLTINGETIVDNGLVVPGDALDIAVVDFLANGGDQIFNGNYLSQAYGFTRVGVTDQLALRSYIEGLAGGDPSFDILTDSRYDLTPDGRIVAIPEPASLVLLGMGGLALLRRRAA